MSLNIPLITALVLRVGVAIIGLLAARLTFDVLNPQDFILFSALLFGLTIAATFLYPINRWFWAEYSPEVLAATVWVGSLFLLIAIPVISVFFVWFDDARPVTTIPLILLSTAIYGIALHTGRYSYGSMVMQKRSVRGVGYLFVFALAELLFVLGQLATGSGSIEVRLLGPAVLFLLLVPIINFLFDQSHFLTPKIAGLPGDIKVVFGQVNGKLGLLTMVASGLMVFSSMIDRVAFPSVLKDVLPAQTDQIAGYVLIIMYASAYLSILALIIDWLRPRIYTKEKWQMGAPKAIGVALLMFAVILAGAVSVGWVVGRATSLIPDGVDFIFWLLILTRFTLMATMHAFQIDLWMSDNVGKVILPWFCAAAASPLFLYMFAEQYGVNFSMGCAALLLVVLACREAFGLQRRYRQSLA